MSNVNTHSAKTATCIHTHIYIYTHTHNRPALFRGYNNIRWKVLNPLDKRIHFSGQYMLTNVGFSVGV